MTFNETSFPENVTTRGPQSVKIVFYRAYISCLPTSKDFLKKHQEAGSSELPSYALS